MSVDLPDVEREALRDLVRTREDARCAQPRALQRLQGLGDWVFKELEDAAYLLSLHTEEVRSRLRWKPLFVSATFSSSILRPAIARDESIDRGPRRSARSADGVFGTHRWRFGSPSAVDAADEEKLDARRPTSAVRRGPQRCTKVEAAPSPRPRLDTPKSRPDDHRRVAATARKAA